MGSASEECSQNVDLPSKVLRLAPVTCVGHYPYYMQIYPTTNTSSLVCMFKYYHSLYTLHLSSSTSNFIFCSLSMLTVPEPLMVHLSLLSIIPQLQAL